MNLCSDLSILDHIKIAIFLTMTMTMTITNTFTSTMPINRIEIEIRHAVIDNYCTWQLCFSIFCEVFTNFRLFSISLNSLQFCTTFKWVIHCLLCLVWFVFLSCWDNLKQYQSERFPGYPSGKSARVQYGFKRCFVFAALHFLVNVCFSLLYLNGQNKHYSSDGNIRNNICYLSQKTCD